MDLLKELGKYRPINYENLEQDSSSIYVERFNSLLHQIRTFAKQQLKTVQEVELIRDGVNQKVETERKLYEELLKSKSSLERQKEVLLGGILNIIDTTYHFVAMMLEMDNHALTNAAQKLKDELEKNLINMGLVPINRVGEEFDPTYHYTVSIRSDDSYEHNAVLETLRNGYVFEGEVIRKADVIVNNKGG